MRAIQALRAQKPVRLVVAAPTAAPATCEQIRKQVDELVCLITPEPFLAIGFFYREFPQLSDDAVREILHRATIQLSATSN
jgi:putative phosphoribosyl transferase